MLNKGKNVEPTSESGNDAKPIVSGWVPTLDIQKLSTWDLRKCEILFDNGEVRNYWDDWPFAIATHYRLVQAPIR